MTKVKQGKIGCGCLPLTLLTIITVGTGYYFGRNLLGSELTPKSIAKITPQSAFVTSYISTNAKEWSKLNQFATPTNQQIIGENLENFVDDRLKALDNNLDYQKDIAPWIGGISFALLPSSSTGIIDFHPVTIIGIKNKFQAWRFFLEQKEKMDTEVETKTYKNIALYNVPDNNVWATIFDNYLIVSDSEDGIQQIIDTYKGEASLAQLDTKHSSRKSPLFQVYFPEYDRFLLKAIPNLFPGADSDKLPQSQLGKINSVTINVNIEDHGFNFKTILDLGEKITPTNNQLEPISDTLLAQIPQETILMFNGGNIDKIWQNIKDEGKNTPELDEFVSEAKELVSEKLNLDLETDLINWLDGEFIFSISSFSNTQVKGSLLLQSNNQKQGTKTLNYLTNQARKLPSVEVKKNNIKGINVTELTNFRQNLLSYGWLNNNSLLVTFTTDFQEVVNVTQKNSLLNNETFQITTESLPQENYGYFYLDLQKTIDTADTLNPSLFNIIPPEIKAISESLKAIAITSSSPNPNTSQLDINLSLQKYD